MITSQIESLKLAGGQLPAYEFDVRVIADVLLSDWQAAGLLHPSLLRLAKIATVDEDLVEKTIGSLSRPDREAARRAFRQGFSAWVG